MQCMLLCVGCCRWNATIILCLHLISQVLGLLANYYFCGFTLLQQWYLEHYTHVHSVFSSRFADNFLLGLCTWSISALSGHSAPHNSKKTAAWLHSWSIAATFSVTIYTQTKLASHFITLITHFQHMIVTWLVLSSHVLYISWAVRPFCWPLSRHEPHIMSTALSALMLRAKSGQVAAHVIAAVHTVSVVNMCLQLHSLLATWWMQLVHKDWAQLWTPQSSVLYVSQYIINCRTYI